LQRRELVQSYSPRYSLTGSLDEALQEEWDLTPWNERALEHFAIWAEQQRQAPERVAEETDAILGILQWAQQEGRWAEALRLERAVEDALALGGRWGAWAQVLGWELETARELGDRAAEAWSLHQSGTRALCLEDSSTARENLTQALQLRESLGDWEGAALTQHNLELLGFSGPDGDREPEGDGGSGGDGGGSGWWSSGGWWGPRLWIPGAIVLVLALVLLGALLASPELVGSKVKPDEKKAVKKKAAEEKKKKEEEKKAEEEEKDKDKKDKDKKDKKDKNKSGPYYNYYYDADNYGIGAGDPQQYADD